MPEDSAVCSGKENPSRQAAVSLTRLKPKLFPLALRAAGAPAPAGGFSRPGAQGVLRSLAPKRFFVGFCYTSASEVCSAASSGTSKREAAWRAPAVV